MCMQMCKGMFSFLDIPNPYIVGSCNNYKSNENLFPKIHYVDLAEFAIYRVCIQG